MPSFVLTLVSLTAQHFEEERPEISPDAPPKQSRLEVMDSIHSTDKPEPDSVLSLLTAQVWVRMFAPSLASPFATTVSVFTAGNSSPSRFSR